MTQEFDDIELARAFVKARNEPCGDLERRLALSKALADTLKENASLRKHLEDWMSRAVEPLPAVAEPSDTALLIGFAGFLVLWASLFACIGFWLS